MVQHAQVVNAETLLNALSEGVIGVDSASTITYLSPATATLLGLATPAAAHGLPLERLLRLSVTGADPLNAALLQKIMAEGTDFGPIINHHIHLPTGDEISINYTIRPIDQTTAAILIQRTAIPGGGTNGLFYQACHDMLTRLPNRSALQQTLEQLQRHSERQRQPYSLLLMDLDRFKLINDGYGHAVGDALLQHFAREISALLRRGDTLGRWGGEEFLCLLPGMNADEGAAIANQLRTHLHSHPLHGSGGREISVTTSVGIASFPADGTSIDTLLSKAGLALTEAKRAGRDRVYTSAQTSNSLFSIAAQLEQALQTQRIRAAYQPIVDLASDQVVAEEALARLVLPEGEVIPATQFIGAAERLHLAHRIDHQLTRNTILRCRQQIEAGHQPIVHFVNISADLLRHPDLVQDILQLAVETCSACFPDIEGEKPLVIEITERELLDDVKEARRLLQPFIDFGLRLAIDDFGSGYSSLLYLADLPVKFLKIEGELVRRAPYEPRLHAILRGVQDLAGELGLITIAEYVENETILATMRDIGVHWAQGYHFGRPQLA